MIMEHQIQTVISVLVLVTFLYNFYTVFLYMSDRRVMYIPKPERRNDVRIISVSTLELEKSSLRVRHLQQLPRSQTGKEKLQRDPKKEASNSKSLHFLLDTSHSQRLVNSTTKRRRTASVHNHASMNSTGSLATNMVEVEPANFSVTNERVPKECLIRYPNNNNLKVDNLYWQVLNAVNQTVYLYNAFYDKRIPKNPNIRILGVSTSFRIEGEKFFCQLWYEKFQKAKVRNADLRFLWPFSKDKLHSQQFTYMVSCPLNRELKELIPFAVSIVANKKCHLATNKLKVIHNPPQQKPPSGIGVCVKGLDFPEHDISFQLVEWMELLILLGVNNVRIYIYTVHPNTEKVLEYYRSKGLVDLRPLTLPGKLTNDPLARHNRMYKLSTNLKRHLEILPYNDCFYHGIYRYKYITLLDIDEVIVPLKKNTWQEFLDSQRLGENRTKKNKRRLPSSYQVKQTGCFFDGVQQEPHPLIPLEMHKLQHIHKIPPNKNQSFGIGMKGFFFPERVLAAFNHFPFACVPDQCRSIRLNESDVQLQHYKNIHRHCNGPHRGTAQYDCDRLDCLNNTVVDKTLWKYKDQLIPKFKESVSAIFKDRPFTQQQRREQ